MYLQTQQWLDPSHGGPVEGVDAEIPCLPLLETKPINEGRNERSDVLNLLRGQQVDVPDLHQMFEGWPEAMNVNLDSLRTVVDDDLNKYELRHAYSDSLNNRILSQALPGWQTTLEAQGCRFRTFRINVVARCIFRTALHCNLHGNLGRLQMPIDLALVFRLTNTTLKLFAWDDGML